MQIILARAPTCSVLPPIRPLNPSPSCHTPRTLWRALRVRASLIAAAINSSLKQLPPTATPPSALEKVRKKSIYIKFYTFQIHVLCTLLYFYISTFFFSCVMWNLTWIRSKINIFFNYGYCQCKSHITYARNISINTMWMFQWNRIESASVCSTLQTNFSHSNERIRM